MDEFIKIDDKAIARINNYFLFADFMVTESFESEGYTVKINFTYYEVITGHLENITLYEKEVKTSLEGAINEGKRIIKKIYEDLYQDVLNKFFIINDIVILRVTKNLLGIYYGLKEIDESIYYLRLKIILNDLINNSTGEVSIHLGRFKYKKDANTEGKKVINDIYKEGFVEFYEN